MEPAIFKDTNAERSTGESSVEEGSSGIEHQQVERAQNCGQRALNFISDNWITGSGAVYTSMVITKAIDITYHYPSAFSFMYLGTTSVMCGFLLVYWETIRQATYRASIR